MLKKIVKADGIHKACDKIKDKFLNDFIVILENTVKAYYT